MTSFVKCSQNISTITSPFFHGTLLVGAVSVQKWSVLSVQFAQEWISQNSESIVVERGAYDQTATQVCASK